MKLLKKVILLLLCIVLSASVLPVTQAASAATVTFTLIGADREGNYVVWIPEGEYAINKLSHVGTVLKQAADAAGLTLTGLETNYISAITAPEALGGYKMAEFTNGPYSGWMYTIDGLHPGRGVNAKYLKAGDDVVFHYVNDYRYEVEDWSGGESLGTREDWNGWLDADDSWLQEDDVQPPAENEPQTPPPAQEEQKPGQTPPAEVPEQTPPTEENTPPAEENTPPAEGNTPPAEENTPPADTTHAAAAEVDEAIGGMTVTKANEKTRKRLENIRRVYDALSAEEQAQVTRYETLEDLEAAFDKLLTEACEEAEEDLEELADDLSEKGSKEQKREIEDILEDALEDIKQAEDTDELKDICDDAERDMKKAAGDEAEEEAPVSLAFSDVAEEDWFYADVAFAVEEGLFNGTSETAFSPHVSMNRAMLVTVLYRLEGEPAVAAASSFTDVEAGRWYTEAVCWASENGIVSGYGNGLFGAEDLVTREQLAAILYRYAAKQLFDVSAANDLTAFADCGSISSYALSAMGWANAEGLIGGRSADTLAPKGTATRAEVAAILHRFAENF